MILIRYSVNVYEPVSEGEARDEERNTTPKTLTISYMNNTGNENENEVLCVSFL